MRIIIGVLIVFNIKLALAGGDLIGNLNTEEIEAQLSRKEKFIYKLHNRHSPKHVGIDDPDLPAFLQFRPTLVFISGQIPGLEMKNQFLELRALNTHILRQLSPEDLRILMQELSAIRIRIKWSNYEGHTRSGKKNNLRAQPWEKNNAATVVALNMALQSEEDLFAKLVAAAPEAILPTLHGHLFGLLNPHVMAEVISMMLLRLDGVRVGTAAPLAKHIANLVQSGLVYWVNKDILKLNLYLRALLSESFARIDKADKAAKEQLLGILLGSLLAGVMKHTDAIKVTDEKRIWVISLVANFAWAATTFIGVAPIASPFVAATAGGLSIGAVLSTTILNALDYPRNYTPTVKEIEGNFEMAALEAAQTKDFEGKIDTLVMLQWMQAAIHVNGAFN